MTAPNPKEALELKPCPFCGGEADVWAKRRAALAQSEEKK